MCNDIFIQIRKIPSHTTMLHIHMLGFLCLDEGELYKKHSPRRFLLLGRLHWSGGQDTHLNVGKNEREV